MSATTKVVIIKPRNPAAGLVARTYARRVGGELYQFVAGQYKIVSSEEAEILSKVRQKSDDPNSPLVFDVFDSVEQGDAYYAEIEERRKVAAEIKGQGGRVVKSPGAMKAEAEAAAKAELAAKDAKIAELEAKMAAPPSDPDTVSMSDVYPPPPSDPDSDAIVAPPQKGSRAKR